MKHKLNSSQEVEFSLITASFSSLRARSTGTGVAVIYTLPVGHMVPYLFDDDIQGTRRYLEKYLLDGTILFLCIGNEHKNMVLLELLSDV